MFKVSSAVSLLPPPPPPTGGLVGERRGVLLRIIVLGRVGDNTDLDILANLLPDLLALLVVVGLADVLMVRLALLLPDLLAFLLVLGLAHLVGDLLAGPVLLVVAFGVVVDR